MIVVGRKNVMKLATNVQFPDGTTDVALAVEITASCGCYFAFGLRTDNAEMVNLNRPCSDHQSKMPEILDVLISDNDTPTDELLEELLNGV
jgi:hypothetical protein